MSLEIKNIAKHFGGIKAVDNASLSIEKNKIIAIIGPNGSGKSTLFNLISSLMPQDAGTIHLGNTDITELPTHKVAQAGIARTFQEVRLFRNLTIQDHIEIALLDDDQKLLKTLFSKKQDIADRVKATLKLVGLNKPLDTYATDLSYGQRKLLDLAIAIAKPHSILMLDEPVAGINPKLRVEIKGIIKNLKKRGETILLIEHDMNFVMDLADYVYVLDYGKIIAEGTPKKVQNNKKVLEAYLGE